MITYFLYHLVMPRLLAKVVAALLCAFAYLTGYKPVACYKLLYPKASAHRRCATHPYTSKINVQPLPNRSKRIVRPVGKKKF